VTQALSSFGRVTGADLVLVLRTMVLKRNKLDNLPHWLFKAPSHVLLPLIVCFVNCVLKTGLPRVYKHAIITPLSKSASFDANELKNYRPVSNFLTMVKIIENVIAKKIVHHLESNSLMDPNQSAYRKHHSCETIVLSILNDIYGAIARKEISLAVLLDMSAAFDTLDHDVLIDKLEKNGITDEALDWLRMYLKDRTHCTQINDDVSESLPLKMGVPQGSVLGPLLFTIYIRELGEVIRDLGIRYSIYADDVLLLIHAKPSDLPAAISQINECLNIIKQWTASNFLQLNSNKTEFIAFGSRDQLKKVAVTEVLVNDELFQIKPAVRYLGIYLDSQLKFTKHINHICRAAYANLKMLQSLRSSLTNERFSILAHALVLSRIEFSPAVLHGVDECEIKKLQRVIKATDRLSN
jgi:hypothetical protein